MLKKFKMDNCKPICTLIDYVDKLSKYDEGERVDITIFKSLDGTLNYLRCTRPDILYAIWLVSHYMEAPTSTHLKTAKRILSYIKGTINFGIFYSSSKDFKLIGYNNSDSARDIYDKKSTTGFMFFMGDTAFTWMSNKWPIITISICEAKRVPATLCVCLPIWLGNLLKELNMKQEE